MGLMDAVYLRQKLDLLATDNLRRAEGRARDDLLDVSRTLEAEARRMNVPDFVAVSLLRRADILSALARYGEAIESLDSARTALRGLRQHDLLVSLLTKKADAFVRLADGRNASATSAEGIALVEAYRYKVSSQYLQSAYLRFRIGLYASGVRAAFELGDRVAMLQRMELSKSRAILRQQPGEAVPAADAARVEEQFTAVCAQIDAARARGLVPDELLMKRRTLWDLLVIRRAADRADRMPTFDLDAVQATLTAEEAVLS